MPRTKEQNNIIKEERRDSIIRESLYLFAFNSFEAVTIDLITKSCNCSHGLFYHYFKTKDDVFHGVMEYCIESISIAEQNVNPNQKAKYVLHDLLFNLANCLKDKNSDYACIAHLVLNLHLQKDNLPKPPKNNKPRPKRPFEIVYELIVRGQKEGDFDDGDPYEYTIAILTMIKGLAYSRLKLGYKKFICPDSQIMMNIVLKRNK